MSGAIKTLFLPFETDAVPLPATGENWAFLNAAASEAPLPDALKSALACEQGTRPEFLRLQKAGFLVKPELDGEAGRFQGCLVISGKHRGENQQMIARAARLVAPGYPVIVAGDKNLGIASLRKWVAGHAGIAGSLAKHHATVFWFEAPAADVFPAAPTEADLLDGRFETAPGMFSPGKVDPGSALLAGHFDKRITGAVADFGSGWGYLSAQVFARGHPASLALYEAHYPSLRAAEHNIAGVSSNVPVATHWHDIVLEPVARQFDWIVMNPPFHSGRSAEPDIGKAFIAAASRALKPGGRLLMVANRKLPYEQALTQGFRRVLPLEDNGGFKVFEAVR